MLEYRVLIAYHLNTKLRLPMIHRRIALKDRQSYLTTPPPLWYFVAFPYPSHISNPRKNVTDEDVNMRRLFVVLDMF
ncbi:unnamed protein product [Periconia digitata]|uniref:Uncharacterized protein n=1 Tax=Periconia digitata TaxID=1303443 RepID=A0A9W4UFS6_9PLEO|nr:unnamed protein product [Periconia digitata]